MNRTLQNHLIVISLYTLLTIILTYPVAFNLTTHIPGHGDAFWFLWDLWWFKHALVDLQISPLQTDMIFYPVTDVPVTWQTPYNEFFMIPVQLVFGVVVTYNLLFLTSFILSGYTAFLLALHISRNRLAAFLSGLIFTFSPYHYAHGLGHLSLITIQWMPLAALMLFLLLARPTAKLTLAAAIAVALVGYSSPYYLVFFGLPFGILFLIYQLWILRHDVWQWSRVAALSMALTLALLLMLPFYLSYAFAADDFTAVAEQLSDTARQQSADLLAYLLPAIWHPWWTDYTSSLYPNFGNGNITEMTIFLGYTALGLSIWAVFKKRTSQTIFWLMLALITMFLSFGPTLYFNGIALLPLPNSWLMEVPYLRAFRVPSRYGIIVMLAVAMLSSVALADLFRRFRLSFSRQTLLTLGLSAIICFETLFMFPFWLSDVTIPDFYKTLATDSETYAILELPTSEVSLVQYYQTYHQKKLVNGYVGKMPLRLFYFSQNTPFVRQLFNPQLFESPYEPLPEIIPWPDNAELARHILATYNIRYTLFHLGEFSPEIIQLVETFLTGSLGQPIYRDEQLLVYHTPPETSCFNQPLMYPAENWHTLSMVDDSFDRPMPQRGTFNVLLPAPQMSRLVLEGFSYFEPRPIAVTHNQQPVDELVIHNTVPSERYLTEPFALPAGRSQIHLESLSGCVRPMDLFDESTDPRCLSIALQHANLLTDASANFADLVSLLGYTAASRRLHPGDTLDLDLYWRTQTTIEQPYHSFLHLVDEAGQIQQQLDQSMVGRLTPLKGHTSHDHLRLTLDDGLPAGEYELYLGVYDPSTMERLPILDLAGHPHNTQLSLGRLIISEPQTETAACP